MQLTNDRLIKVLVVDDSAFMRKALSDMIGSDPELTVIATARDGLEAVEKVIALKPDIVTMDVEMPRMDGIEALKQIMAKNPLPVIMVSSLTAEGAKVTLDALELGAIDFIPKNLSELSVNILKIRQHLVDKIKHIGRKGLVLRKRQKTTVIEIPQYRGERRISIVAIGTSTGGPRALQEIIPALPKDFPVGILIAQHMPPSFTGPFAERLNQLSQITVKEAEAGEPIKPGIVFIAPGGGHMRVKRKRLLEPVIDIGHDSGEGIYRPSVDALMLSVVEFFPGRSLGVILTGMGNDGMKGMIAIKKGGGRTIAQNEETCVVYGMPRAVVDAGVADKVVPLDEIAGEIINSV